MTADDIAVYPFQRLSYFAAFPFAYELLAQLVDKKTADQIAEGMRFKHLMA